MWNQCGNVTSKVLTLANSFHPVTAICSVICVFYFIENKCSRTALYWEGVEERNLHFFSQKRHAFQKGYSRGHDRLFLHVEYMDSELDRISSLELKRLNELLKILSIKDITP